jgi:hypothetical protein
MLELYSHSALSGLHSKDLNSDLGSRDMVEALASLSGFKFSQLEICWK